MEKETKMYIKKQIKDIGNQHSLKNDVGTESAADHHPYKTLTQKFSPSDLNAVRYSAT